LPVFATPLSADDEEPDFSPLHSGSGKGEIRPLESIGAVSEVRF
jgi:hypothetical protein